MTYRLIGCVLAATLVLTGCGGDTPTTQETTTAPTAAPTATIAEFETDKLVVYTEPNDLPAAHLPKTNGAGARTVLLVRDVQGDWADLYLPRRPNGTHAWAPLDQLTLTPRYSRIDVDTEARTITVTRPDHPPITDSVAVGSPDTPTPAGLAYVTENVEPDDPRGPYGKVALGLSVYSETLTDFGGGDGQVAIHATTDQASIGEPVSHGCVRVTDRIADLLTDIPTGTPVHIT